ncbi:hypothetical protein NHX12_017164 [Muraenolepis orangiensis]|uniref:Uncharacterized protein n=1 Tax=Muraenolepis orangiensis TaxID=630683 RepID=A0A9Q0D3D0_9TELE|nr:hypothetical protein NHX12_017164 [Muraenolepis orangiensis]
MDSSHLFSLNKKLLLLNCLFYNHKLLTCDHNCKEIHKMDLLAHEGDGLVAAVVTKCTRLLKCIRSWLFFIAVNWMLKRWPGRGPFPWIRSQRDKPVILVVLHHTFDPEKNIIPQRMDSSHLFSLNKKLLLLNCLFYNHKLLTCDHNCKEIHKVIDHLSSFISKR